MSRLCQCLQRFWALHAQDEAAALIQSFKGREEVSYLQLRKWQQEVKAALGDGEWEVVGVNLTPFSIEETALVLLVAEEKRRIYVPLDTQLPVIRQLEMVRSSGVQRLVTTWDSPLAKLFASSDGRASGAVEWRTVDLKTSPFQPVQVLAFSDSWLRSQIQESLLCRVRQKLTEGDNSAPLYVLFTSGTTGKPRGVVGTRTGAWTRCEWMWTAYPFATSEDNGERVLRATKLSFVDSVWEILGAFLQRVPLVHIQQPRRHQGGNSARQDTAKSVLLDDSARFLEVMRIEQVTRFTAVPSVLEMLLLQTKETELQFGLAQLRYILSSGEILSVHAVQKLTTALPEVAILNLYGSTEVSGDVTCMELKAPMTLAQLNEWQECGIPIASLSGNGVLHEAFGPHPVKSHELLEMTIGEVLSSLDDLKENPGVKAFPDSTQHKPVKDWDSDSDAGSAIKRRKLVNSVCTDTARTADETTALTYVSRYNQSSLGVNGVYMPTCYASPLSSSEQTSATSLSTSWVLKRQWRVDLKKCIDASPLVIQRHDLDGAVISTWAIVGSHSGQLVCVDVQDNGREVWRVTLDDRIEASATLSVKYGLVYVGTYAGTLFALEMHSGDIRWRFRAIEAIKAAALVIDTRKLVVFGAYDSNLYGLDAVTGQRRWAIDLQGSIFSTPLYCGWSEKLFAATTRGIVVAFQFTSSTGDDVKEQWKLQLPAPVFAGLNADYASKILVAGCADGNLYGLSTDSGSMQWRLPTEKPIFSSPCVYRAGSLVFGSHDGMLRRVNSRSGELIWSTNLHGAVFASSTVVRLVGATPAQCADTLNEGTSTTDGQLVCCVATTTGRVYFCDENTGSIIYQTCESSEKASSAADTSENCSELGPLFGSPVLIDKWCLLGTRTNYFYGFELKQTSSNEN
ncbi:hypothetical protein PF003_g33544 [Phytophthora fragariae]|nr:hypothetical protein PF003_g33544 [Phytophthora fragariae]